MKSGEFKVISYLKKLSYIGKSYKKFNLDMKKEDLGYENPFDGIYKGNLKHNVKELAVTYKISTPYNIIIDMCLSAGIDPGSR